MAHDGFINGDNAHLLDNWHAHTHIKTDKNARLDANLAEYAKAGSPSTPFGVTRESFPFMEHHEVIAAELPDCQENAISRAAARNGEGRAVNMTLREEFASRALAGLLANSSSHGVDKAMAAVHFADKLLKELAK